MDAFISRKRYREPSPPPEELDDAEKNGMLPLSQRSEDESTEMKLAILASMYADIEQEALLESLLACEGSIKRASESLSNPTASIFRKKPVLSASSAHQSSLSGFAVPSPETSPTKRSRLLTKKHRTLHLYSPEDIAEHTPCSMIQNFLPAQEANDLLMELLKESQTFQKGQFKLFNRVVESPHSMGFYVMSREDENAQKTEYAYQGRYTKDVRLVTPHMRNVSEKVQEAVNREIQYRIDTRNPNGKKLKFQSPEPWVPNAVFVNCYAGGSEGVGYHSDQLTYLGPRPVIGSISLGVTREFRIRKIIPRTKDAPKKGTKGDEDRADAEGQISIHLPHNSLLVMHADMQEEWKHSIHPAQAIDPHPVAGNRRINITYRYFREQYHPRNTPQCKCGLPTVLRCVQKKSENAGRYFWMCHGGYDPEGEGCDFFEWAEIDDDGIPLRKK